MKRALITGVNGQDGSYLAELLINRGYDVYGMIRRSSVNTLERILHIPENEITLVHGDMTDSLSIVRMIQEIQPDEIYNLAAQSHVAVSFEMPEYTSNVDGVGTLRVLEAVRILNLQHKTRIYQASTSELYGKVAETPQNENTPFYPRSPYGVAKQYAYWITKHYRETYGLFASNGILFNHESERRGETFVTRKITLAVARIVCGLQEKVELGNLDAKRDWGYAPDYVDCMHRILQHDTPDDFVIATGETHTVREFCSLAFEVAGIPLKWTGSGTEEKGIDERGVIRVLVNSEFFRPAEVDLLLGNPEKAKRLLMWNPVTTPFGDLVKKMVYHDIGVLKNGVSV